MPIPVISKCAYMCFTTRNNLAFLVDTDPGVDDTIAMSVLLFIEIYHVV